jgi:hypothetical protein
MLLHLPNINICGDKHKMDSSYQQKVMYSTVRINMLRVYSITIVIIDTSIK